MSGCIEHEGARAFGCKNCDAIASRVESDIQYRNFAWLRTRILELEAEIATLRAMRCTGTSGCPNHLVLNVEDNSRGCEHGTLVGYCHTCKREIQPGETHLVSAKATEVGK